MSSKTQALSALSQSFQTSDSAPLDSNPAALTYLSSSNAANGSTLSITKDNKVEESPETTHSLSRPGR